MLAAMMPFRACQAAFWELAVAARLALTVRVAELLQERDTNH
jgi:hypothetical protein